MEQLKSVKILQIIRETPDAATLTLEYPDGRAPHYLPGQYVSVIRSIHGTEKRRAYSFSSAPETDAHPAITVRRVPNGEFSNWLLQDLRPGDLLTVSEAHGQFILPDRLPRRLIYIAAGSGITPVMSHLKALLSQKTGPQICLLYANRDSRSTIFKKQLDELAEAHAGRLHLLYFFSREKGGPNACFGHLNNAVLESVLEEHYGKRLPGILRKEATAYLCAPKALMRMAAMTLRVLDMPDERIRQENFVPDTRLRFRQTDNGRTHHVRVHRGTEQIDFDVYAGETILNGALRQGIALPYTCKSGVCFSCLARCVQGEAEMDFVDQTRREGAGALINTCIGYVVSRHLELTIE
jgi:ring-1,2-phenylacetyl-CoA epoxidase subunit PaaE